MNLLKDKSIIDNSSFQIMPQVQGESESEIGIKNRQNQVQGESEIELKNRQALDQVQGEQNI